MIGKDLGDCASLIRFTVTTMAKGVHLQLECQGKVGAYNVRIPSRGHPRREQCGGGWVTKNPMIAEPIPVLLNELNKLPRVGRFSQATRPPPVIFWFHRTVTEAYLS
jgi:hypothetical protein